MGPVLTFKRGVARDVRKALRAFFRQVQVRFEHELPIVVVPSCVISIERGLGFGGFVIDQGKPKIYVGGQVDEELNYTVQDILSTAAHELAHYEQFRDGRELTERGVNVRARGILRGAK